MKLNVFEREGIQLVQGTVVEKRPGTGAAEGRVINVKIKGDTYDADAKENKEAFMEIAFWNNDSRPMADNANARLNIGDYVSALVTEKDGKYSALGFKKTGIWTFEEKIDNEGNELKEVNFIIGVIGNASYNAEKGFCRVSVPVSFPTGDGNFNSEWVNVTFWNNETRPNQAENVNKVLAPFVSEVDGEQKKTTKKAILRCGELKYFQEQRQYVGYGFDRIS